MTEGRRSQRGRRLGVDSESQKGKDEVGEGVCHSPLISITFLNPTVSTVADQLLGISIGLLILGLTNNLSNALVQVMLLFMAIL